MGVTADGAKATFLIGLEEQVDGYQIGVPALHIAEIAAPSTTPTATPGSSGNVSGAALSYKYSHVTISRGETECSTASTPAVVSSKQVTVGNLDWGTDDAIIGIRIYRQLSNGAAWLHIGTVWDTTKLTVTYLDNIAPGSEDVVTTVPSANETANNYGLTEMPIDPGEVVRRENVDVVPNELTGTYLEREAVPVRTQYPVEFSASFRVGHLVPLLASLLGKPTVSLAVTAPIWTLDYDISDDPEDSISLCGMFHMGGGSTRPRLFGGMKISELEVAAPGNTEMQVKAKGMACRDTEQSPGIPDGGNSGTSILAPVLWGTRGDDDAYTKTAYMQVSTGPSGGTMAVKFKIDSAGTLGPATTVYYAGTGNRVYRYGSQDEPGVVATVGTNGDWLGIDEENCEPVVCMFPGDTELYAVDDLFEFTPELLIPDGRSGAAYSGQTRLQVDQTRFSNARIKIMRGLTSADDYLEFEGGSVKLSRTMVPKYGAGPSGKRPKDLILQGKLKIDLGFTRFADSREFDRYARAAKYLYVQVDIEGPRIWTNPGVRSTTRELFRITVDHAKVGSKYTIPDGPVKEAVSLVATQPRDGSTGFSARIITSMGWDFDAIALPVAP